MGNVGHGGGAKRSIAKHGADQPDAVPSKPRDSSVKCRRSIPVFATVSCRDVVQIPTKTHLVAQDVWYNLIQDNRQE
jgi:hypothetical protein